LASIAACLASVALLLLHKQNFSSLVAELRRHQLEGLFSVLFAFFMPYWATILFTLGFLEGDGAKNNWRCWGAWLCATAPGVFYLFVLFWDGDPGGWGFWGLTMYGPIISPVVAGVGVLAGELLFRFYRAIAKPVIPPPTKEITAFFRGRMWRIGWASIAGCLVGTALLLLRDVDIFTTTTGEIVDGRDFHRLGLILFMFFLPYWPVIALTFVLSFFKSGDALNNWRCWGAWLSATILVAFFLLKGSPYLSFRYLSFMDLYVLGFLPTLVATTVGVLAGDLLFRLRRAVAASSETKPAGDRTRPVAP
jgi:hypothetical protein